ncbi:RnfABCDGE type electron transport complex subunit D [Butyrivibrio sp. DSM 10294]|uniref:RnfABCDGE type electron transport complex subunit D n=1 Tax=Butyrivibrio sp. DSM 10294 TaxID=2972457 RepID=UPI00234F3D7F|nr:RnfABCDGE type electron transport complex subunit D [Butyrivibrio sp. DSM 10294]MDC7294460.1 RnfABCDGE type electron transport complex subunit D [Butyrivibrio sp. DSM 10294]
MSDLRRVSSNPHVRSKTTTSNIMMWVVIALLPAAGYGIYNFGLDALIILLLSVASCVLSEFIYEKALHKPVTVGDLSAVVTGLLLGMNLPSTVPWWIPVLGGIFSIIMVKQIFGGLGQNFMNPALGGRCFLVISFPALMTNFIVPDTYTGATPLALLKSGVQPNVMDMLIGRTAGTIGETSMLCIAIGAMILFAVGIIDYIIPFTYIITFVLFVGLFGGYGFNWSYISAHVAGGGLMLGAFFMATDYVTCPITTKGKYIYAFILGLLTGIFRIFGANAEGVSFAIVIGNLLVPLIEKFTIPRAFGIKKTKKEAKKA